MAITTEANFTLRQAANLLQVSYETLRRWVAQGEIPAVLVGKRKRILASDLDEFARRAPAGNVMPASIRDALEGVRSRYNLERKPRDSQRVQRVVR